MEVSKGADLFYREAKKIGVKTVWGTDTLFDPRLAKKQGKMLARLGRWYPPVEALRQATSTAGELLVRSGPRSPYQEGPLGVVQEGAYTDLVLVNGNPLENLEPVADTEKNFVMLMNGGKI